MNILRQLNISVDNQLDGSDRGSSPAANKGFAIAGVPCFADSLVQGGSSVLRMKFSAKTPRHRKPPKR